MSAISLALFAEPPAPAIAGDCRAAAMYLQMADRAIEDSSSWASNSSDAADSLSRTSMEVAEHYVDLAGRQFNETECGSGILMWWFGDTWETYPIAWLTRDGNTTLVEMLRSGKKLLNEWHAKHWDRAHPNEYQGARDGFHRLQLVAKFENVDPSGNPPTKTAKRRPTAAVSKIAARHPKAAATQGPGCERPNVPATALHAIEPDTPAYAQQQGIQGTVQVIVTLDASSHVTDTKVQSSPSAILNNAALSAARQSTYQTEIRDCKPVPADFIFSVDFTSQ